MKQVSILAYRMVAVENCPFCGSDNLDIAGGSGSDSFIKCNNCRSKGPGNLSSEVATQLWNACNQNKQKEIKLAVDAALVEERSVQILPVAVDAIKA